MWTRKELKTRAKSILKKIYWKAFLVSLVILAVGGNGIGGSGGSGNNNSINNNNTIGNNTNDLGMAIVFYIIFFIIILFVVAAFRIFLGYSLEVGGRKYFIQSSMNKDNKKCFRFGFDSSNYLNIVTTMLLKGVQNFLWYLLLIIPGIVKAYAYKMVPYILADNPNIGRKKAIKLSIEMTKGHKFNMWVLDLSFIGWYLLGVLALGIGVLFVFPYVNATQAELYLILRENVLKNNICTFEELNLNPQEYASSKIAEYIPEEPDAEWECPNCNEINPNTSFTCSKCKYKMI